MLSVDMCPLRFFLFLLPDEKVVICVGYKKRGVVYVSNHSSLKDITLFVQYIKIKLKN